MLDYFNQNIKPLNEELREALGIKKINVELLSDEYESESTSYTFHKDGTITSHLLFDICLHARTEVIDEQFKGLESVYCMNTKCDHYNEPLYQQVVDIETLEVVVL